MKTVFVSGNFNVIHPGHQRLLKFAKGLGDKLIVGILPDKYIEVTSFIGEKLRLEGIQSISFVDEAFILNDSLQNTIRKLKPNIIVKGKEHESKFNAELKVIQKYGGKLIFSSGDIVFSSVDILNKEFSKKLQANFEIPQDYLDRHKIKLSRIKEIIKQFNSLNVCVIGDLIIDEYIMCQPIGMSQEDPTLVVSPLDNKKFLGGAGIVAAHSSGLGAKTHLFSVVGNDKLSKLANKMTGLNGIYSSLLVDDSRPTTLKQKFRRNNQSLLKINHVFSHSINKELQKKILSKFKKISTKLDILIFSDFNYGCLPKNLVSEMTKIAKKNNIFVAADSQSSSQVGDICKFQRMNIITPTEHEARTSTNNYEDGLVVLSSELQKKSKAKNIFLKLGDEGLLIHNMKKGKDVFATDRINALNSAPLDVSGAGDSLLIASVLALRSGGSIWEAGLIGSIAASIQVGRTGNVPLKLKQMLEFID